MKDEGNKYDALFVWPVRGVVNGVTDIDSDGDGTPDDIDGCPDDTNKIDPSICGCGVSDNDSDSDGTPDCNDGCPNDSNKTSPGVCGCGIADIDSDNDWTLNCNDSCPYDPNKIQPGVCGCNIADIDTDTDGAPDCNDGCPNDSSKTDPGVCGCGVADTDADADGFMICTGDCDDTRGDIHPDAPEICDDGIDNNCDGEDNVTPTLNTITATVDPIQVGGSITASAAFTDPNDDTHTIFWDWGDGTTSEQVLPEGQRTIEGSHTYTQPGVYTITLTVSENNCGSISAEYHYVVVYDPNSG